MGPLKSCATESVVPSWPGLNAESGLAGDNLGGGAFGSAGKP
jgi:hypothetical protein